MPPQSTKACVCFHSLCLSVGNFPQQLRSILFIGQQTKLMPAPPELVPATEGMDEWHMHKPHPIPLFPGPDAHSGNLVYYLISHLPYYCFLGSPHNELLALGSWNEGWLPEDPQRKTLNITILIIVLCFS